MTLAAGLVVALAVTILTGYTGDFTQTTVLVHSESNTTMIVQGEEYNVSSGEVISIPVSFKLKKGISTENITVQSGAISYQLPITLIGKPKPTLWWPLALLPLAGVLFAVRVRKLS